jgi:hypothetical protein
MLMKNNVDIKTKGAHSKMRNKPVNIWRLDYKLICITYLWTLRIVLVHFVLI